MEKARLPMRQARSTYLHADDNGVEVQNRLPVLPENVQAHISFQINIRMIDLLRAFDLRWIVGEVLVHDEREVEHTTLVHSLVWLDRQSEVEDVIGVGEGHFHRAPEGEFLQV
jgi:hypothetical protein